MGKRSSGVMLAMLVTMLLCGNAAAIPYTWRDSINMAESPLLLDGSYRVFNYPHIISDLDSNSFNPRLDDVSSYTLKITLKDDENDRCEIAYVNQPGLLGDGFYNFFNHTSQDFGWSLLGRSSLNETGTLEVDIIRLSGDFYFLSSDLEAYGCKGGEPIAVYEPGAMMILGFGLFGLAGCARKRFKR
jgi:hypothetical protein